MTAQERHGSRFDSTLERSDNKLWGCHFRVPKAIAAKYLRAESRRVVCTLEESVEYQCALLPSGRGDFLITVNRKIRDTLGLSFGDRIRVALRADTSEFGLPMPDELRELLRQDRQGNRHFRALTAGKQRTLLYIVGNVKNPEKRILRAVIVVRHLTQNGGKINFRKLSRELQGRA